MKVMTLTIASPAHCGVCRFAYPSISGGQWCPIFNFDVSIETNLGCRPPRCSEKDVEIKNERQVMR